MKILSVVLGLLIAWSVTLPAQNLPFDKQTGKITFSEVIHVGDSSTTRDELYSRAREWFARAFKSSQNVLMMDDKESGKLIGKGNLSIVPGLYLTDSRVDFTLSLYLKNGRYKYEITDFNHVSYKAGFSGGALEDEKPDCGSFSMTNKGWLDVKAQTKSQVETLIVDLKLKMSKTESGTGNDW